MKFLKSVYFLSILLSISSISCDRDDKLDDIIEITEEEALEMVSNSLASEAYGIAIQAKDASELVNENKSKTLFNCGVIKSKTIERNSLPGAVIKFTHAIDYESSLFCENDQPNGYAIAFKGNGTYESLRLESDDTITYQATLTNITNTSENYIYNSSFTRDGTQITKIAGRIKNFDSKLTIENKDIVLDKDTLKILEGYSTFSLTGTLNTGATFSYSGTVIFQNDIATVTINGNTYDVQI